MLKWLWSLLICSLLLLTGCSTTGIFGKAARAESKAATRIEQIESSIAMNNKERLQQIGELSYGTSLALRLSNTVVATELNNRVQSLAEKPTLEQSKNIERVALALMTNAPNAQSLLDEKDQDLIDIQDKGQQLAKKEDIAYDDYMTAAGKTAMQSDANAAELKEWTGWFGLKGVFKGLFQFAKSSMWFFVIGGLLLLVLRVAASANPIAGAVFSIFNIFGSWCINIISFLIPKAIEGAKLVSKSAYDLTHETLKKVVDSVEQANVQVVKDNAAKLMNDDNKQVVSSIKKELLYK